MSNPVLLHLPLRSDLVGRDRNGVVTATANGPVRFTADGYYAEEATTNGIKNPSFETDTTGWQFTGASLARVTTTAYNGIASAEWVWTAAGQGLAADLSGYMHAATQGQAVTAQARVRGTGTVRIQIQEYNAISVPLGLTGSAANTVLTDAWTHIAFTYTMTSASAAYARLRFDAVSATGTVYVDSCQIETKPYATSYCDGSLGTGYTWSGTAHNSASSRAASYAYVSETARIAAAAGSVALRLKRKTDTGANQPILDVGDGTAGKDRLTVRVSGSDQAQMAWASNGAATTTVSDPDPIATVDTSRFVYAEWNGTATGISVDNTTLVTGVRDAAQGDLSSANDLLIGTLAGGSAYADASISDLLIFDRPLTDAERATLAATPEWSFGVLQPRIGGALRISNGIGLAISGVAAPAALAIASAAGGLS